MGTVQTSYTSWLNSFEVNFPCCCGCCTQSCGCDDCGRGEATCGEANCGAAKEKCGRDGVCCRSIEWFAGFRYIEVGSDMDIGVASYAPLTENGQYTVNALNRLFARRSAAESAARTIASGWN